MLKTSFSVRKVLKCNFKSVYIKDQIRQIQDSIEAWLKHEEPNSTRQQQEDINQTTPARLNTACNGQRIRLKRPENHLKILSFSWLMKLIISMHNCILCT